MLPITKKKYFKYSLTKLVVFFNHWFMPYKVERGRSSFQCGTSKNCLRVHMSFLEAKNAPTTVIVTRDGNGAKRGRRMGSSSPPRMTGKISCPIPAP